MVHTKIFQRLKGYGLILPCSFAFESHSECHVYPKDSCLLRGERSVNREESIAGCQDVPVLTDPVSLW